MNEFIEKNRRLLMFYCIAARIIGWVIVILSVMPALSILFFFIVKPAFFHEFLLPTMPKVLNNLLGVLFDLLLLGVIVLGVAQLIRYVSESKYQPGWLLRHGTGILYLFAVLKFVGSVVRYFFLLPAITPIDSVSIQIYLLVDVAKMLILIGLADILKRVLPVIQESKTLV